MNVRGAPVEEEVYRPRGTRPIVWLLLIGLGAALIAARLARGATVSAATTTYPAGPEPREPVAASGDQLPSVRTRPGVPLKPHSGNGHAQESPTGSRDT